MTQLEEKRRYCLSLITRLSEHYRELPAPGRHDWLAAHPEEGQPFSSIATPLSFLKQPLTETRIHLFHTTEVSERSSHLLSQARRFLAAYFQVTAVESGALNTASVPHRDGPHRQLRTRELVQLMPENAGRRIKAVCVTSYDLYPVEEIFDFVFGEADSPRGAVVSTFHCGFGSRDRIQPLLRFLKMLVHEVGHLYYLEHCTASCCNMNGRNSMDEVDRQPLDLCPDCLAKLCWVSGIDVVRRFDDLQRVCADFGLTQEANRYGALAAAVKHAFN